MVDPRRTEGDNYKHLWQGEVILRKWKKKNPNNNKNPTKKTKPKLPPKINLQRKGIIKYQSERDQCPKYNNNKYRSSSTEEVEREPDLQE